MWPARFNPPAIISGKFLTTRSSQIVPRLILLVMAIFIVLTVMTLFGELQGMIRAYAIPAGADESAALNAFQSIRGRGRPRFFGSDVDRVEIRSSLQRSTAPPASRMVGICTIRTLSSGPASECRARPALSSVTVFSADPLLR